MLKYTSTVKGIIERHTSWTKTLPKCLMKKQTGDCFSIRLP